VLPFPFAVEMFVHRQQHLARVLFQGSAQRIKVQSRIDPCRADVAVVEDRPNQLKAFPTASYIALHK
jgi:hypothetical protein